MARINLQFNHKIFATLTLLALISVAFTSFVLFFYNVSELEEIINDDFNREGIHLTRRLEQNIALSTQDNIALGLHQNELQSFSHDNEHLFKICIYNASNDQIIFDFFTKSAKDKNCPELQSLKIQKKQTPSFLYKVKEYLEDERAHQNITMTDQGVSYFSPIHQNHTIKQWLYLERDLAITEEYMEESFGATVIAVAISLLLSFVVALIAHIPLIRPLRGLTQTIDTITRTKDFSIRTERMRQKDEFSQLGNGLNMMLDEIQIAHTRITDALNQAHEALRLAEEKKIEAKDARTEEEKARESSRLKSEFLANMSHEIRTPMNGVIGMTNLLLETNLTQTQQKYAQAAMGSAEHLLQLVNDILDFSKIEAGKLEFEIIPFDLQSLVEDVADLSAIKAHQKGLELLLRFPPETPRFVLGDPGRMRQILFNLTSNALKFTENGHVLIGIDILEQHGKTIKFRGYVQDTGIGIPEEKHEHIFGKFSQADSSTTRQFGGTGLGLAICQKLVEMMNGEIGLDSVSDVGSTFWFTFELDVDETEKKSMTALDFSSDLSDIRVLVVNDSIIARDIIAEHIRKYNMRVDVASSAKDALILMHEAAEQSDPYEIAVLDYIMPITDGMELGITIKNDPVLKETSLLMVTSAPNKGDKNKFKDIGFDGYLVQPTSGTDIMQSISAIYQMKQNEREKQFITRHLIRESNTQSTKSDKETIMLNSAQILLAEDNPTNQMVATTMLEKMGCLVTPAGNGLEAVNLIKKQRFDLIFMDCNMPEMDGYESTKKIRELEKREDLKKTPIIAFTAYAIKGDEEKCYEAGMDDYITKPVKKQSVVDILEKWLPHKQQETP